MRALLLAAAILAGNSAHADEPVLTMTAGGDQMAVAPDKILSAEFRNSSYVPDVLVILVPALQPALAAFTLAHVNEEVTFTVCGVIVSEPVLRGAITTNEFVITGPDANETRRLAAVLHAKDCQAASS